MPHSVDWSLLHGPRNETSIKCFHALRKYNQSTLFSTQTVEGSGKATYMFKRKISDFKIDVWSFKKVLYQRFLLIWLENWLYPSCNIFTSLASSWRLELYFKQYVQRVTKYFKLIRYCLTWPFIDQFRLRYPFHQILGVIPRSVFLALKIHFSDFFF